tara:strand:- start:165 stop:332 length:168 start_codon:yes stop_codon:yes gene_type:complete
MNNRTKRPISNRTKVLIVLAITGWIRVLIVLVPIGMVWYGNHMNSVTTDTELIQK